MKKTKAKDMMVSFQETKDQDERWVSVLPDSEFTIYEAAELWGITHKSARYRIQLIRSSGLVSNRILTNKIKVWKKEDRGM